MTENFTLPKGPDTFEEAIESINQLRTRLLCNELSDKVGMRSEQHYLLALAAMDAAQRHMELSAIEFASEVGGLQGYGR